MSKEVIVWVELESESIRVGRLWFHVKDHKESALLEKAPHILTTAIDFNDTSASLEIAMSVAKEFCLDKEEALLIIKEVASSVKEWRSVALKCGLSKQECDRMASAFVYDIYTQNYF